MLVDFDVRVNRKWIFHWRKHYYGVWTLVLTAPIHCRGSIAEQVMQCYILPYPMNKQTNLHLGQPDGFCKWVNYSFKTNTCLSMHMLLKLWGQHVSMLL